jgi:tetratricopeptide (TPR) repeat protein
VRRDLRELFGVALLGLGLCLFRSPVPASATDVPPDGRVLLRDRAHRGQLPPEERFAVAWQLADTLAMRQSLQDADFPSHLRHWARARWLWRAEGAAAAVDEFSRAADAWPRDAHREAHEVRVVFDRQRMECAIEGGRNDLARVFVGDLRGDPDDPVLEAWKSWLSYVEEAVPAAEATVAMDRAWSRASRSERRSAAYLRRSVLHLAAGDSTGAAGAWLEALERAWRPAPRRRALDFWDAHPELQSLLDQPEFATGCAKFLARNLRRPDALDLLRERLTRAPQDAESFALAAEQFYRLRDDAGLEDWLARPWPSTLDEEQVAELESLPLGVERRGESSTRLAQGFEGIARRHPQTRRAAEALWEAGWMYEIDEDFSEAQRVYDEYVERSPHAPFAEDAALRGLLMRYRQGADIGTLEKRFDEVSSVLGEDAPRGSALWLLWHCAAREKDAARQGRFETELEEMSTPVPLWRVPSVGKFRELPSASDLVRRQAAAFADVREALGGDWPMDPHLREVRELLRLGLTEEGESEILAMVRDRTSETRLLFDCARVAWEMGSPEVQARIGFLLRRRLADDGEDLQGDLWVLARPTPFYDAVRSAAREFDLSEGLLWSVMRRESFYDPDVISVAGAYGLVQIMPDTARRIAKGASWPSSGPDGLLAPAANLRFGAFHLRERLDDSSQDPFYALAAYNAGPVMARRWRQRMPEGEPPAFLDLLISYTETRGYVYDVLRNAALYASVSGRD